MEYNSKRPLAKFCGMVVAERVWKESLLGDEILCCPIEKCPYGNLRTTSWQGDKINYCGTEGVVSDIAEGLQGRIQRKTLCKQDLEEEALGRVIQFLISFRR